MGSALQALNAVSSNVVMQVTDGNLAFCLLGNGASATFVPFTGAPQHGYEALCGLSDSYQLYNTSHGTH